MSKPKKRPKTTVEFQANILTSYQRMVGRYGVKTAVSAGILLLERLTPVDREKIIDEVSTRGRRGGGK